MGLHSDGQLGFYNADAHHTLVPTPLRLDPDDATAQDFTDVALGARHSAFLFTGRCYTAGDNTYGQLGLGAAGGKVYTPKAVDPKNGGPVEEVVLGSHHSAFRARGHWYVWGKNDRGQCGGTAAPGQTEPWILCYTGPEGQPITKMALGGDHTAVLAGGNTYVMGSNDFGQLGLGAAPDGACSPVNVTAPWRLTIRRGARDLNVTDFVLGYAHSTFFAAGRRYMSGRNNAGQLGLGDNADACAPRLLAVATFNALGAPLAAEQPITAVALGDRHSAVVFEGRVFVMGANSHGQLGSRSDTDNPEFWVPQELHFGDCQAVRPEFCRRVRLVALGQEQAAFLADETFTPTTTATPTPTPAPTPSPTPTGTRTVVPTATRTATLSAAVTRSGTRSPTASHTATPTTSPTPTPSPTRTDSRTATASGTRSATTTATPSPSPSSSTSGSPTASPTPTLTATLTPRPTPTHTSFHTPTLSRTPTLSATKTLTAVPTATPSPTETASVMPCARTRPASATSPHVLQSGGAACYHAVSMGPHTNRMQSKSLRVKVVTIRLDSGCPATGGGCPQCAACTAVYTADHMGQSFTLPVDVTADIQMSTIFSPPRTATATARHQPSNRQDAVPATPGFNVEVAVLYTTSGLFLLLIALIFGLLLLLCLALIWRTARRTKASGRRISLRWYLHLFWGEPRHQLAFLGGLYLLLVGSLWFVLLGLLAHPDYDPPAARWVGLALAGLGALLMLVAAWAWVLRDRVARECPACQRPASAWRFMGTYLACDDADEPDVVPCDHIRKACAPCVRCLICRHPVTEGRWQAVPQGRQYHRECSAAHRAALATLDGPGGATATSQWSTAEVVTDVERAHVLMAMIDRGNFDGTVQLLTDQRGTARLPPARPPDPAALRGPAAAAGGSCGPFWRTRATATRR